VKDLQDTISRCEVLALDTMVFSYHLSDHPRYAPLTSVVLTAIESGQVVGLTTTLTLAELLTAPAQAGDQRAMEDYELYLTRFPNLRVMVLDATLARETARVRAASRLRTPDAIQVAAARLGGADAIVTNDRRWAGRVDGAAVVMLDDYLKGS
jgi:predicted nucleic acid-binding protein